MFLQTSADIVRRHPELEPAVRFVDGVLEETSSSAILDLRELARVSGIDENQIESVLELYAGANQVIRIVAIECESCHVLTPSRTRVVDGEELEAIRCSKCDRPVNAKHLVTVYQYTATSQPPKSEEMERDTVSPSKDLEVEGIQMSADLSQEERGFLRNLLENALPDMTAIDNFIDFIHVDDLAKALRDELRGENRTALYNSIITIAHTRHMIGDLLLELSRKLGRNRDDIAVAGALFTEKYQKAKSASPRDTFFSVERSSLEKLTSVKPFLRVKQLGRFLDQAERRICKVKCQGEDQGTGFLIGEDLVLTCFHVVENGDSGKPHAVVDIEVEFDFLEHGSRPTTSYKLAPGWDIPHSKYSEQDLKEPPGEAEPDALDYAVLKLSKAASKDVVDGIARGFFDIGTQRLPSIGTPILIAGHPGPDDLKPLSFSMAAPGYEGLNPNKTRIIYKTSTDHGSSGSPVFDHNFNVIGLHHNRGMIASANTQYFMNNRGIPTHLIADHFKKKVAGHMDDVLSTMSDCVIATFSETPDSSSATGEGSASPRADTLPAALPSDVPRHWTDKAGPDGWWYKPDPNSKRYRGDMLILLVHGFCGDAVSTWGDIHLKLHDELDLTCDVLTYDYPAGMTDDADIEAAGSQLSTLIQPELDTYQHILVLAHSAGGLVVKKWLCEDTEKLREELTQRTDGSSAAPIRDLRYAILSVRQIINFDVPHAGAHPSMSQYGPFAYDWLIYPALKVRGLFGARSGYNRMISQLRHNGEFVTYLEKRYVSLVKSLQESAFPRPVSVEFLARADKVIAPFIALDGDRSDVEGNQAWVRSDADTVAFRRTHTSVKEITEQFDTVLRHLARHLRRWKDATALNVAIETLYRADEFLLEFRCRKPFGVSSGELAGNTQAGVLGAVEEFIVTQRNAPSRAVVSGAANVGKSVLVRFLSRIYALRFLQISASRAFMPVFVPMQLLPLDTDEVSKSFFEAEDTAGWRLLLKAWCEFADDLVMQEDSRRKVPHRPISIEWLSAKLKDSPCVVVFDSVDEFFDRHRNVIEIADLRRTIAAALCDRDSGGQNSSLRLLHFVRETLPDYETLAPSEHRYVIRQPTEREAFNMFPDLRKHLQRVPQALREIVISPLLLPTLARHIDHITDEELACESSLYEQALLWLIRDSRLVENNPGVSERQLCDITAAIVWDFYSTRDYVLGFNTIQERLTLRIRQWSHSDPLNTPLVHSRRAELADLLKVVASGSVLQSLLQKTVFVKVSDYSSTSHDRFDRSYRVQHENWVQQLGARYLADCVRAIQPNELAFGGCTKYMFKMAGQRLQGNNITRAGVLPFLEGREITPYVPGNFSSTFTNSTMTIDGDALHVLLNHSATNTGIAQVVLLNGFGWRVMLNSNEDGALHDLRAAAVKLFNKLLTAPEISGVSVGSVSRSIAWCNLQYLGEITATEWPELWDGTLGTPDSIAVSIICDAASDPPRITPAQRSLQRACIEIQETARGDEAMRISLVHYLYLLAIAYRMNGAIAGASSCLRNSPLLQGERPEFVGDKVAIACRRLIGMKDGQSQSG